jgi:hypothetical protein
MIELAFPHRTYMVKSEIEELSLQEYESITNILSDESKLPFEKYIDVLVYLGVEEDDADNMNMKALVEFAKNFSEGKIEFKMKPEIEIAGDVYIGIEDGLEEPKITPKVVKLVEKIMAKKNKGYMSEILAVMLKKESLTKNEHYEPAHIKYKAKIFQENVSAEDAVPYIMFVTRGILENIKDLTDGVS